MDNEDSSSLEKLAEEARRILEDFQPSLLLTTVLEYPQSPKQSYLAPAYCHLQSPDIQIEP